MMRFFPAGICLLAVLCALFVPVSSAPAGSRPTSQTASAPVCEICLRSVSPDWKYCPYDGHSLMMSEVDRLRFNGKEPMEVLYEFLRAVSDRDDQHYEAREKVVAGTMDLEGIVGNILKLGIEKLTIPAKRKEMLLGQFVPEASHALVPVIVRVLLSREFQKNLGDRESLDMQRFKLMFQQEITGDTARVYAVDPALSEEVYFRKVVDSNSGARWVITKFPEFF